MSQITYREALRMALQESMREDSTIIVMGEDVGLYGGAYGVTKGMIEEFGEKRILDTPNFRRRNCGLRSGIRHDWSKTCRRVNVC